MQLFPLKNFYFNVLLFFTMLWRLASVCIQNSRTCCLIYLAILFLKSSNLYGQTWMFFILFNKHCSYFTQINVGCTTDSSSEDPVRLEFSRDFGATWHLLLPLCYSSSSHVNSLCTTEHHPSSTYYAGTMQGWRREVINFGKLHLCGWVSKVGSLFSFVCTWNKGKSKLL